VIKSRAILKRNQTRSDRHSLQVCTSMKDSMYCLKEIHRCEQWHLGFSWSTAYSSYLGVVFVVVSNCEQLEIHLYLGIL